MNSEKKPVVPNRRPMEPAKIEKVGSRIGVKTVGAHYRCKSCGNEVTVDKVGGGVLICCGQEMELIKEDKQEARIMKVAKVTDLKENEGIHLSKFIN